MAERVQARSRGALARLRAASDRADRPLNFMEVCGTHTTAAFRLGLPSLMPENVLKDMTEQQIRDLFSYLRSSQPLAE